MVKKTLFVDENSPQIPFQDQVNYWLELKSNMDPLSLIKIQELLTFLVRSRNFDSNLQQLEVLDAIFMPIYNSIIKSDGLGDYKTIACDSLVVWISRSIQLLNKFPEAKVKLQSHISFENCQYLFHYVLDFWNDSGAALGNSLRELFVKLISFISITSESKDEIFKSWLIKSLNLPHQMRVFYFMIEHLYKEVKPLDFVFIQQPKFIENSLNYIWSNALASNVGRVIFLLLRHIKPLFEKEIDWVKFWANDIINGISNPKLKKPIESYLLSNLFKISTTATMEFLKFVIIQKKEDISTILSCLKLAQESSILIEPFLPSENGEPIISMEKINSLLKSTNGSYRIGAFSLLVSSPKLSKAIPSVIYKCVLNSLDPIYVDNDLETRNEMFSYLHKFINRIKDSVYALDRDSKSLTKKNYEKFQLEIESKETAIIESETFFKTLIDILKFHLKPGSSYQRKEMSLRILKMIINSGLDNRVNKKYLEKTKTVSFIYSVDIYDTLLIRLLVDNISDDFEDIRINSTNLLNICPLPIDKIIDIETTQNRAMHLLGDMKGKSVDSGARFFQFLFGYYQNLNEIEKCKSISESLISKIKLCINEAERDICTACYTFGIQGYFAAFKFIFEIINFKLYSNEYNFELSKMLIELAAESWFQIKPILQHDSPEGNLPTELKERYSEELELKYGKGTQVILSYAWRSMKESTTMIDVLLRRCQKSSKIIDDEIILKLGPNLIEQLSTIRHRGAFSSIYPTFVSLCSLCKSIPNLEPLPREWLQENLELTKVKSKSITRRSAGVPYLITAILTSYHELMENTFEELVKISMLPIGEIENNINLPQVNAFNCIKVLFIDSNLSDYSIYYVDRSLDLALNAISSPIWSIRNCAVMLFTALQNRLFSSKKVRNNQLPTYPARLFFNKFKNVKGIFYNTLNSVNEDESNLEKIFPILTIMSRLEPTPDYKGLDEFNDLIVKFLSNKVWKVREMAARSFPSIIGSRDQFKDKFINLLNGKDLDNNNLIHGLLLAQREMLERVELDAYQGEDELLIYDPVIRINVLSLMDLILNENSPWAIKLVSFQNLKLIKIGNVEGDYEYVEKLKNWFELNYNIQGKLDGAKQLALKECCKILFDIYYQKSQDENQIELINLLKTSMFSKNYELQLSSIEYISKIIDSFNLETLIIFVNLCWDLIGMDWVWKHVKSNILVLLKDLNIRIPIDDFDIGQHLLQLIEFSNDSNEQIRLATVETLGSFIGKALMVDSKENGFNEWILKIKTMVNEDNESHIRSSALNSLIGFHKVYFQGNYDKFINFGVIGLIFNYLSDDDDNLAINASVYLLNNVLKIQGEILAIEVEKSMIGFIIKEMKNDLELTDVVLGVETELKWYCNGFKLIDESKLVDLLSIPNDLLFGSEKSNLDRDMTLRSLNVVKIIEEVFINGWDDHLLSLKMKIEDDLNDINTLILHGEMVEDGPLGVLSQESNFTFVYDSILIGKCLSRMLEIEELLMTQLVIKSDDQWHELIFRIV